MIEYKKLFFNVGERWTYMYTFKDNSCDYTEFIHCEVLEQIFINNDLHQVKVKQIHNLEDYLVNKNYDNYSERTLNVDFSRLGAISNW